MTYSDSPCRYFPPTSNTVQLSSNAAPVYAPSGDRMAEIVEDGNGEKLPFSNR